MEFSADGIINAAELTQSTNVEEQQQAIDYIDQWMNDESVPSISIQILTEFKSTRAVFYVSNVLEVRIPDIWETLDVETKRELENLLYQTTVVHFDNVALRNKTIKGLVEIAVYDFPENWPEFESMIFPPNETYETGQIASFYIFSEYVREIEASKNITGKRCQTLRLKFIDKIDDVINRINFGLQNQFTAESALVLQNAILWWSPAEEVVSYEHFVNLLEYVYPTETRKEAIQCLLTLFSKRVDSSVYFAKFAPTLFDFLTATTNVAPITTYPEVIEFLLHFCVLYSPQFEALINPDLSHSLESLRNINNILRESIQDLKSFLNNLMQVYRILLELDEQYITEQYWQLWREIIRRMFFDRNTKTKYVIQFYEELFPEIRKAIYHALPSSIENNNFNIFNARLCWSTLFHINQISMIDFLSQQPVTGALGFAIGTLEFAAESNPELMLKIYPIVNEIYEAYVASSDVSLIPSLLFALSHSPKYLTENTPVFLNFVELFNECIQLPEEEYVCAAVYALHYVVQSNHELFMIDNLQLVALLAEASENYIVLPNSTCILKMFHSVSKLIDDCGAEEEKIVSLFTALLNPVISAIQNYNEYNAEIITTSFQIVEEVLVAINKQEQVFWNLLWPPVKNAALEIIPNMRINPDVLESMLNTLVVVIAHDKELIETQEIFQLIEQRDHYDSCIFSFIGNVRKTNPDMNSHYPYFRDTFINPALSTNSPPYTAIIEMITYFQLAPEDIAPLVPMLFDALLDSDQKLNIAAIHGFTSQVLGLTNDDFNDFFATYTNQFLQTIFRALIDSMHKDVFDHYVDLLRSFLNRVTPNHVSSGLESLIETTLALVVEHEPEPGFFKNFSSFIINSQYDMYGFRSSFANLLICLKKISPSDAGLFKVKTYDSSELYANPNGDGQKLASEQFLKIVESIKSQIGSEGRKKI